MIEWQRLVRRLLVLIAFMNKIDMMAIHLPRKYKAHHQVQSHYQ